MFIKLIKKLIIIKLLLNINLVNKVLADEELEGLNISEKQLHTLAEQACSDVEEILGNETLSESCRKEILSAPMEAAVNTHSPKLEIKCQTRSSVTFKIKPSNRIQLIILLAESNTGTNKIHFTVIKPHEQYGRIRMWPPGLYTMWGAKLDLNGSPMKWIKGPRVPFYNATLQQEHRDYNISVRFPEFIKGEETYTVMAVFDWDASDEEICYEVANICDDIKSVKMWPTKNPVFILNGLPTDKSCEIHVIGPYGTSIFKYQTPSCADSADCVKHNKKPWSPAVIELHAREYGLNTWEVRVNWTQPKLPAQKYNVTLYADDTVSKTVDGNATEVTFKGITGKGYYYVVLDSIIEDWIDHTSRSAVFPGAEGWAWWWMAVGAWALALAATTAAATCHACRNHRTLDRDPLYPELEKIKEFDMEAPRKGSGGLQDQWEVQIERLVLYEVVGEGAFGVVRKAILRPQGRQVAVKMLKDFPLLEEIRSFRAEIELMKSVGVHPHIVNLVGCCTGSRPLIVTEYCSRGDLLSYLRCSWDMMVSKRNEKYYNNNTEPKDYTEDTSKCEMKKENPDLVVNKLYNFQDLCESELTPLDLLSFCRQIAMGMEFLASNKVVHRDLAARNVLVTDKRTLKIADFGLSRDIYEDNHYKQKTNGKLPVKWMALESLTRKIYTTQSDIWSFGIVIWEIVTVGGCPYAEVATSRLVRLLKAGYRMPRPNNCSEQLYEVMCECWRAVPRERPSFGELHRRLDQLLQAECATEYLTLELDPDDAPPSPPPPKAHNYFKMINKGKRYFKRGESYERPLKPSPNNHYTSPPAILSKTET